MAETRLVPKTPGDLLEEAFTIIIAPGEEIRFCPKVINKYCIVDVVKGSGNIQEDLKNGYSSDLLNNGIKKYFFKKEINIIFLNPTENKYRLLLNIFIF